MDVAQEIKRQYGKINFNNPAISFTYNQIVIKTKLNSFDYINIIAIFLVQIFFLIIDPFKSLWWHLLIFIVSLFLIYTLSSGANKVKIDFFYNKVEIAHQFLLFNIIRNILKVPVKLSFSQIDHIYNIKGGYFGRTMKNFLLVKSFGHPALKLAHFNFERDSQKLAELLNKYIVGELKLNE